MTVRDPEGRNDMKKITVRKAGAIRLTSAAASSYCIIAQA
jgi:hypothetical protein